MYEKKNRKKNRTNNDSNLEQTAFLEMVLFMCHVPGARLFVVF